MSGMRREAVQVVRPDLFVSLVLPKVLALGEDGQRLRSRLRPGGCQSCLPTIAAFRSAWGVNLWAVAAHRADM